MNAQFIRQNGGDLTISLQFQDSKTRPNCVMNVSRIINQLNCTSSGLDNFHFFLGCSGKSTNDIQTAKDLDCLNAKYKDLVNIQTNIKSDSIHWTIMNKGCKIHRCRKQWLIYDIYDD